MSVTLFDNALWLDLPPIPKLVLAALCERANVKTGRCWPSIRYISQRVSLSERRAQDHLKTLEDWGYLERLAKRHGRKRTIQRRVVVDRILAEGRAALDAYRAALDEDDEEMEDVSRPDESSGSKRVDRPIRTGRSRHPDRTTPSGRDRTVASDQPLGEPLEEPNNIEPGERARELNSLSLRERLLRGERVTVPA